ncbi:unnamed protein product, partial [Staurois parvus]
SLETSAVEERVDNKQKVIAIENLGFTHEPNEDQGELNQQDPLFGTVVITTSELEEYISTSADSEMSLTSELYGPDIDITSLTQNGHIPVDIVNEVQSSSNEETITIYLNEVDHENREPGIKEENLPILQTSCHEDITIGQEQTLDDEMGMSNEPAVQEEDDLDFNVPFHSMLDVSAQKSRVLLLRKTSVRRRPGQRPVTFQEELADPLAPPPLEMGVPLAPESSSPTGEATETSNASEPLLRRKSSIRRRPRPATFQGESSLPWITSAEPPHPTEELGNESTISEQTLNRKSSIRQHQEQHPMAFEDEPIEQSLPLIMPQKMGVPNFLGGIPILSPTVAPAPESPHPAEEPRDEGTTSEPMLRRKSSVRRPKGKQPVTSEDQPTGPPSSVTAPIRMGVALFPGVPAHMSSAPVPSRPEEEPKEEKTASEELTIKPKKGFLKHAGFGGAHPGMMQELQARLHKKKPKE